MSKKKFGIQTGPFSGIIYGGRLDGEQARFIDREDVTENALQAVAKWVEINYQGSASVIIGGYRMEIDVTEHLEEKEAGE